MSDDEEDLREDVGEGGVAEREEREGEVEIEEGVKAVVVLSSSGLDAAEDLWLKRLVKALGSSLLFSSFSSFSSFPSISSISSSLAPEQSIVMVLICGLASRDNPLANLYEALHAPPMSIESGREI